MITDQKRSFKIEAFLPWLIFAVAFAWRSSFISIRDISLDEPFTIFHAQKSIREILKMTLTTDSTPPFFMILLHFWIKLFGIGQFAVRSLPLIFNSLTPVFIYLLGKKLSNTWGGLISAFMFIISYYQFYFGTEARAYPLLWCATASSMYYLFSVLKDPVKRIYWIGLLISNIVVVYSHYFGWFVIFMEFVVAIICFKNRTAFKRIILNLILSSIAFAPMIRIFIYTFLTSKDHTWVRPPSNYEYWNQLIYLLNGHTAILTFGILFASGIIVYLIFKKSRKLTSYTLLLFVFWFVPYNIMFFVSSKVPMFVDRYILFNSIGLYLFTGTFLALLFEKPGFLAPIAGIILIYAMSTGIHFNSNEYGFREVRQAVNYLKKTEKGNSAILIHPRWTDLGFMYYYNKEIFSNVDKYDSLLDANKIYPVWGIKDARERIKNHGSGQMLYYQDGSQATDPDNTIFHYLDSIAVRIDSVYFPQSFYISAFDLKKDSVNIIN